MFYRSISDANDSTIRWSTTLPSSIDLIVGVPRSGLLPATMLALHMHKPVMDLNAFLENVEPWTGHRLTDRASQADLDVLVVDDSSHTGREMRRVRAAVAQRRPDLNRVRFGALYVSDLGARYVDTWAERVPIPRVFEWNIMHHDVVRRSCMDIDGVFNPDPSRRQNDDGPRYRRFLSETELLYRPGLEVRALVTSRLEKYRAETEDWLARHGIAYQELLMLDLPSAAERRRLKAHAQHKASAYIASGADLFIESSDSEGREIFERTKRPVYITDSHTFLGGEEAKEPGRGWRAKTSLLRALARNSVSNAPS